MLLLRPIYFMLAALLHYLDAVNSALAVILIIIGVKIFLQEHSCRMRVAACA